MSSNRTVQAQTEHDRVVRALVNLAKSKEYTGIQADHIGGGYTQPDVIYWEGQEKSGHIPDIQTSNPKAIIEVETAESLKSQHSFEQWKLFDAFAKQWEHAFYLGVPLGSEQAAKVALASLGIKATVLAA